MGSWKNEDDIKAELRILTNELRQLREELRDMVTPPKPSPTRAFLHRHTWPAPERIAATANDESEPDPDLKKKKRRSR